MAVMAADERTKQSAASTGETTPLSAPIPPSKAVEPTDALPATAAAELEHSEPSPEGSPVAGLVASAGGLDAFKKFFTAMPAQRRRLCAHPASRPQARQPDGRVAGPLYADAGRRGDRRHDRRGGPHPHPAAEQVHDHFGRNSALTGPVERGGLPTSIDLFLRSLAEDKREKAICIVLSGTGSHGSLGLKAIKAADGMAMVQDPSTAEYPRMPESAIATGLADYVLPVEQMPEALVKYVQYYVNVARTGAGEIEPPDDLDQILALVAHPSRF